jgi:glycerol-3-phosphate dehydrogenase (NAD(P)+)
MSSFPEIAVLGAGAFGTAMAESIARSGRDVALFCRTSEQAKAIQASGENRRFFPGQKLHPAIVATNDQQQALACPIVFLAFPAKNIDVYADLLASSARSGTILVNLVKGLHLRHFTFASLFTERVPQATYVAFKGPTFARPLFLGEWSGLTCGVDSEATLKQIRMLFQGSHVDIDWCGSATAVDAVSAIKNVYAIALGLAASIGLSENTIFLMVSRIVKEIRAILQLLSLDTEALFCYCGLGDTLLTSFCDTSRNRTLGFMIGKGIPIDSSRSDFLAEGVRAISVLHHRIDHSATPILNALVEILEHRAEPLSILEGLGI